MPSHRVFDNLLRSSAERQRQLLLGIAPRPRTKKKRPRRIKFDLGVTLACIGIAVGIVLAIIQPQVRWIVGVWSAAIFAILVYPALHLAEKVPWVRGKAIKYAAILVLACGVSVFAYRNWPPLHRHTLDDAERLKFEEPLTKQQAPREIIQLFCPAGDEAACVYAGQFMDYFREAGWTVKDNSVQAIILNKPRDGVILFTHGEGKLDPANWRSGLWSAYTTSVENVRQAFVNIDAVIPTSLLGPQTNPKIARIFQWEERNMAKGKKLAPPKKLEKTKTLVGGKGLSGAT